MSAVAPQTRHGGCVVLGEAGVLILGRAGSGKSRLALDLIAAVGAQGGFARLVADDRVALRAAGGRLIASAPEVLRGLVERRGIGIAAEPFEPMAVVRAVVSLDEAAARLPEPDQRTIRIEGVDLPLIAAKSMDHARLSNILYLLRSI